MTVQFPIRAAEPPAPCDYLDPSHRSLSQACGDVLVRWALWHRARQLRAEASRYRDRARRNCNPVENADTALVVDALAARLFAAAGLPADTGAGWFP